MGRDETWTIPGTSCDGFKVCSGSLVPARLDIRRTSDTKPDENASGEYHLRWYLHYLEDTLFYLSFVGVR